MNKKLSFILPFLLVSACATTPPDWTITGASVDKYFWNKYIKKNGDGRIDEYLSVYALVSLSKEDYRKTVEMTLSDEQKVTKDVRARNVIKEMKKLYLKNGETK